MMNYLIALIILPIRIPIGILFNLFKLDILRPFIFYFASIDIQIYLNSLKGSFEKFKSAKNTGDKEMQVIAERNFIKTDAKLLSCLELYRKDGIRVRQPKEVASMRSEF